MAEKRLLGRETCPPVQPCGPGLLESYRVGAAIITASIIFFLIQRKWNCSSLNFKRLLCFFNNKLKKDGQKQKTKSYQM